MILWIKIVMDWWKILLPLVLLIIVGLWANNWINEKIDVAKANQLKQIQIQREIDYENEKQAIRERFFNGTNLYVVSESERLLADFRRRQSESSTSKGLPSIKGNTEVARDSRENSTLGDRSRFTPSEIDFINRKVSEQ